jgi:hypothetical protein
LGWGESSGKGACLAVLSCLCPGAFVIGQSCYTYFFNWRAGPPARGDGPDAPGSCFTPHPLTGRIDPSPTHPSTAGPGGPETASSSGTSMADLLSAAIRLRPASERPGPYLSMGDLRTVALGEPPPGALEGGSTSGGKNARHVGGFYHKEKRKFVFFFSIRSFFSISPFLIVAPLWRSLVRVR